MPAIGPQPISAITHGEWFAVRIWLLLWLAILLTGQQTFHPAMHEPGAFGDHMIRNTIRLALAYYFVAAILMLRLRCDEWLGTPAVRLGRCCWTLAWLAFVVHVLVAFHFFHHWDHGHAVAHTRQVSGVGWGIYFSHAFTAVWGLDVVSWWAWPAWYANRPCWIDYGLHGFMAFILFNGTVIFESGPIVWAGAVMFLVLGTLTALKLLAGLKFSGISRSRTDS